MRFATNRARRAGAISVVLVSASVASFSAVAQVPSVDTAAPTDAEGDLVEVPPGQGAIPDWSLSAVPKITLDADNGIGLGVRVTWFWYRFGQRPYKTAVSFQVWATSKLVQHHTLKVDALDAFGWPVRILAEVGYFQSLSQNFCGFGNAVRCDEDEVRAAADAAGLDGPDRAIFVRRYYQLRFMRPYAKASGRWRLTALPHRFEVFAGWRGAVYIPGDVIDEDGDGWPDLVPYPGSKYAQVYPGGEPGLASVLQLGMILDGRDSEPVPTRGYRIEASVRGATPLWLSSWMYGGANVTASVYAPMLGPRLVAATRVVGDVQIGDPPLQEMVRVGGTEDYLAFGGAQMGRGIRVQRYAGRVKALLQHELRYALGSLELLNQRLAFGVAGFVDAGMVAESLRSVPAESPLAHVGVGLSLRTVWNRNFVMRIDVAVSPDEGYRPAIYSGPGHPY